MVAVLDDGWREGREEGRGGECWKEGRELAAKVVAMLSRSLYEPSLSHSLALQPLSLMHSLTRPLTHSLTYRE